MTKKKILFLTGTRADFGKLKSLIKAVKDSAMEYCIFVTGMHTMNRYGYTVDEVNKAGFNNIHIFMNQIYGEPMDMVLANTINGLSRFIHENRPDMIVVHGDRVEALAGAIVGSLNNIFVAHIEGGELSGTIDGLIRHSISKLAHLHFVANEEAAARLTQLGENPKSIYIIGSPDIDIMLSSTLPLIDEVKQYYDIVFEHYSIVMFHPVTTELDKIHSDISELVDALIETKRNYVVIYPNNDEGCHDIFAGYERLRKLERVKMFPSLRFEYFLVLLKHADFIIGNSSAGIREAPVYAVPSIDIGTRQNGRFDHNTINHVNPCKNEILKAIAETRNLVHNKPQPCMYFGQGDSAQKFIAVLKSEELWKLSKQKQFYELEKHIWKEKTM
ncbi:UDP-N-acetylglucosamine 2-epimerase [Sporomusa sp. KB1]|jgi:UDP-N-acetylglucosamine 2-epimerase (hydrolysing)|uniref:UDP-N-acetylglucosamine 2-epimerase n=1 Tax=Sporomusa sp. KB1 TaxID=943346 RepID=UPI0011A68284|nr:UDP-N-acetylglucosamine 2-epimerase [Sporomusa sp. KB1]TWH45289.1 UDP-N-acetylglucosamine 2-epimerase (hydrolysing) [Sporomusa sp. KB1]